MKKGNLFHKNQKIGTAYIESINGSKLEASKIVFLQKHIIQRRQNTMVGYIDFGMQPSAIHMELDNDTYYGISIEEFRSASGDADTLSIKDATCKAQLMMSGTFADAMKDVEKTKNIE